jgi:hypothetical protein
MQKENINLLFIHILNANFLANEKEIIITKSYLEYNVSIK